MQKKIDQAKAKFYVPYAIHHSTSPTVSPVNIPVTIKNSNKFKTTSVFVVGQ